MRARLGEEDCVAGQALLASCATSSPLQTGLADERLVLLLDWAKVVLAHYRVQVDNWTVAWSDGRALCLLVHHYQPGLLARHAIQQQTSFTHQADTQNLDDSSEFSYGTRNLDTELLEALKENEKQNFKLLLSKVSELGGVPVLITPTDMTNTIPDEKVTATFIGYLAVRLLDLSREIKAARTIQLAWRRIFALKKEEKMKVMFSKF
jgi:abnormal spindle-like microcephaly-associated protein